MHIPHQQLHDLYEIWHARLNHRRMPDRADFAVEDFRPWFGHIGILVAERPERGSRYPRWRVAFSGAEITAYDGADWTGQLLDEAVPAHARGEVLAPYDQLVDRQAPVYWQVNRVVNGDTVLKYHRLLLPVSCGSHSIGKVIVGIYADPPRQPKAKIAYDAMVEAEIAQAWMAA